MSSNHVGVRPKGQPYLEGSFREIASLLGCDVWAWGSRLRGDYVEDSDWDVVVEGQCDWVERARLVRLCEDILGLKVDLIFVPDISVWERVGARRVGSNV